MRQTPMIPVLVLAALWAGPAMARLPEQIVPTRQAIHLRLDADSATYSGSVRIDLAVRESGATIQLFARDIEIASTRLTQGGRQIATTAVAGERGLLTLTAARPLERGPAVLEMEFTQQLNTRAVSLYRMTREGEGYTFTQFEADEAREAFPCWDEPSFKIPWEMTLEVPERHEAVFNTPVAKEARREGWRTITFRPTPPMPSYLLAVATGPLEFTPVPEIRHVPTRVVTVRGQSHLTGVAVRETPRILAAVEAWFGMPYPYEKLDLIAVPEYWAGAMENPGAITYADNVLLLDPARVSPARLRTHVTITAHELAHMWFGDYVTMAWWDDLWLNESFADWLGDKLTTQLLPELQNDLTVVQNVQDIMETDARPSTDPIRLDARTGDEAMRAVGIAYNKGKGVLSMFELWLGAEVFQRGIRDYLKVHAWKNATASDLWRALGRASKRDVAAVMAPYIEQRGHALVSVTPLDDGRLRIRQKRFLNHGIRGDAALWKIPMTIKYSDGTSTRTQSLLLDGESTEVRLAGVSRVGWVMPNVEARGYYRWSLPADRMIALAREAGALTPAERIGYLGNLGALLDAGEVGGDTFLEIVAAMARDPEPLVARQVLNLLDKVRLAFVADSLRDAFAGYVRHTLQPMADRFGLARRTGESDAVSLLRPTLLLWLGRDGRDPAVLATAREQAARYLASPGDVDPALAATYLRLAALDGDRTLFDTYCARFEGAKTPEARQVLGGAIGWFRDPAIQKAGLAYALGGLVRPNEMFRIPGGIGNLDDASAEQVFQWTMDHYADIGRKLPESFMGFLPNMAGGCSLERLARARGFFAEPGHQAEGTEKELLQMGEQVEDCAGLRAREGVRAEAYLRRFSAP